MLLQRPPSDRRDQGPDALREVEDRPHALLVQPAEAWCIDRAREVAIRQRRAHRAGDLDGDAVLRL